MVKRKSKRVLSDILDGMKHASSLEKANRYPVVIEWHDGDACFVADVPDLPGCAAHGGTYAEAAANIEQAIEAWLVTAAELGREIPQPQPRLRIG